MRRNHVSRYLPPKGSFLTTKWTQKESDLILEIEMLLPPMRSLGSNLKLDKVTGDGGLSN